jgi:hypothetical protein
MAIDTFINNVVSDMSVGGLKIWNIFPSRGEMVPPSPSTDFLANGEIAFVNVSVCFTYIYGINPSGRDQDYGGIYITDSNFDSEDPADAVSLVSLLTYKVPEGASPPDPDVSCNKSINFSTKVCLKSGQRISVIIKDTGNEIESQVFVQAGGYITNVNV